MSLIEIRAIELEQVHAVAQLPQRGEAGADSPDRLERYLRGEHHPHLALAPRQMWVAWSDDVPVGYVSGHLTERFECDGELQKIYVIASHRRQHVGLRLVAQLAHWFEGHGASRVCVNVGAETARPFYLAAGAVALQPHWMVWNDMRDAQKWRVK